MLHKLFQLWSRGTPSSSPCALIDVFHPFSSTSYLSDITRYSRLMSHCPYLPPELNISPRIPGPFLREWYLETKIWTLGMTVASRMAPLQGQERLFFQCLPIFLFPVLQHWGKCGLKQWDIHVVILLKIVMGHRCTFFSFTSSSSVRIHNYLCGSFSPSTTSGLTE